MSTSHPSFHTTENQWTSNIVLLLRIICFAVFAGRAWQHLFWDAPFRTLLWDESLLKPIIEAISSMSWNQYVTSTEIDNNIQLIIRSFGVFYLLLAFISLLVKPHMKKLGYTLLVGSLALAFLAFLYCKEHFFQVGQFFEYSAQFMSPILLYLTLYSNTKKSTIVLITKVTIALTFICHGLYAANFYPRPGNFVDMTINILPLSESGANTLLMIAGIADFVLAAAIFIPVIATPALLYAFIWGLLTCMARIVANFHSDFALQTLNQWVFEAVYRLPHAGLPLMLLMIKHEGIISRMKSLISFKTTANAS